MRTTDAPPAMTVGVPDGNGNAPVFNAARSWRSELPVTVAMARLAVALSTASANQYDVPAFSVVGVKAKVRSPPPGMAVGPEETMRAPTAPAASAYTPTSMLPAVALK